MNGRIKGIRRRFFVNSLAKYMLMLLVPMLLLSSVIGWVIANQVPALVRENSESLFSVSSLSLDTLFKELLQPKIFIEANPDIHLGLLQYLEEDQVDEKTQSALLKLNQYLDTTRISRNYIHSLYIAKQDAPYLLVNGQRIASSRMLDQSWQQAYDADEAENFLIFKRTLRSYSFEQEGIPVITLVYVTKYHELIVINLFQSYFSHFLDSLTQHEHEAIWVSDAKGTILSENWTASKLSVQLKDAAYATGKNQTDFAHAYQLTRRQLDNKALILYSLIPNEVLNASSHVVFCITLIAASLAVLVSLVLSVIFTRKSFAQINKIVTLFEEDMRSPLQLEMQESWKDPFYYILDHVVSLYVREAHLRSDLLQHSYDLVKARLAALQYQINPHFIFNTLQVIDLQIAKAQGKPVLANQMIQQFSQLLRYSLEDPTTLVPLSQEIAMTKTFLQLLYYRNAKAMQVIWFYEEEVLDCVLSIRMLFQPLLENVLSHAQPKEGDQPIQVRIRLTARKDYIHCSIIDNGCGVSSERLQEIRTRLGEQASGLSDQVGLANVHTRLLLSFDASCALKVYSRPAHGFALFFRIPRMRMENDTF
ncbi:MAG: sensor histidine kinase [Sphaerochaeta sp.]|uniref:sensor histidine kinase n=1 Tax=Sphaerochaeta sp. TaxID=1972642 RepID=UPI003D0B8CAA